MPTLADYPHLVAQLDRRRNDRVDPAHITAGSGRRLAWRCTAGRDHAWTVAVGERTARGSGCPFCAGKRVSITNCLATVAPEVAREWHPTKNGEIQPRDVNAGSNRAAWWVCGGGPDHVWKATIVSRTRVGSGCPFCASHRVSITNALPRIAPGVARQWHPTKNGALRPSDVVAGSHRVVWWRCKAGPDHVWRAAVKARVRGHGCPFCGRQRASITNNLAAVAPDLAREWHPTKNGEIRPEDVLPGSNRPFWWRCRVGHTWEARPADRTKGDGCPFCSGHRPCAERSIAAYAPELVAEWHPTKNGRLTPLDVTYASVQPVWWKCPQGADHEWESTAAARTCRLNVGCPFCTNRRVSETNALASRFPKLAREWHPTKNGELTPDKVTFGTHRRAWWRCAFGHEWETAIVQRTRTGSGCRQCHRREQPVATTRKRRRGVLLAE